MSSGGAVSPALLKKSSGQRDHALRAVFNGLRFIVRAGAPWRLMPYDLSPWMAVCRRTRRCLSAACPSDAASDLRAVLRLCPSPAPTSAAGPARARLAAEVRAEAGGAVAKAFVDPGCTGDRASEVARRLAPQIAARNSRRQAIRYRESGPLS